MGETGLDFMLADAKGSPADLRFATLSFLSLPVIPALKLTDRGLFAL